MLVRSVKTTLIVRERSGDFRKNKDGEERKVKLRIQLFLIFKKVKKPLIKVV